MAKGLTEDDLKALVSMELRQSLGYSSSKLSAARLKAEYYYLGLPVGDLSPPEIEGRSGVVSTDVRDTIESMLPQLMVTFCGSDTVAEFEAQGPDDEGKAKLATEYVNYIFNKKNNGHKVAYTWMKDALLQKNGIVKVWWDTRHEETKESYKNLDDVELGQILDDEEIEVVDQEQVEDEYDAEQRQTALKQMGEQLQQLSQSLPPQAIQAAQQGNQQAQQQVQQHQQQLQGLQQQMAQLQAQPLKMLWNVTCKRVKTEGKIQIDNVPPEEFLISRNAKDIETAKFVGHRVQRTVSELKSMGYKNVDNLSGEDVGQGMNMERIQRLSYNDENAYLSDEINSSDPSQRRVWVIEAYVRCDYDGDGISELRKVTMAGNELLDNEEVDFTPFVSITPVPLPHTFFGLSIADLAMESQKTKTSILRSQLDNLYLTINGRYFAVEGQVNLDDLLTSRPGGVVRMKQAGMAGRLDQNSGDVSYSTGLMEYMQQDLENRTGWSRQSMGNDASGIQTTATAANIVTNKADMRLDLVARNFAEGFTQLFKFILKLVCQHQDKEAMVKLSGGWQQIDPREWRNQFDVGINVGIGMGNKDQKVAHLMALIAQQAQTFPLGVANPQNVYASHAELAQLLGYKNGDKFFTDPSKAAPQPPKPDPEQIKAQSQMQLEQAKAQTAKEIESFKAQIADQQHQREMQRDIELAKQQQEFQAQQDTLSKQMEMQAKERAAQSQAQLSLSESTMKNQMDREKMDLERWKAQLASNTQIYLEQVKQGMEASDAVELAAPDTSPSQELRQQVLISNEMIAQTLEALRSSIDNLRAPRQIVRDANGRAQGIV